MLLGLSANAFGVDAEGLLDTAERHYRAAGRQQALRDFTHDPRFIHGSLYVFCVDVQKRLSASGGFPKMVGVAIDRFEVGGRSGLATRMLQATQGETADDGRIDYEWLNPQSGAIEPKTVRFRRFGDDVCGVGQYAPGRSGPLQRNR